MRCGGMGILRVFILRRCVEGVVEEGGLVVVVEGGKRGREEASICIALSSVWGDCRDVSGVGSGRVVIGSESRSRSRSSSDVVGRGVSVGVVSPSSCGLRWGAVGAGMLISEEFNAV